MDLEESQIGSSGSQLSSQDPGLPSDEEASDSVDSVDWRVGEALSEMRGLLMLRMGPIDRGEDVRGRIGFINDELKIAQ